MQPLTAANMTWWCIQPYLSLGAAYNPTLDHFVVHTFTRLMTWCRLPQGTVRPYAPSRNHAVQPLAWRSEGGQLTVNGRRFHLKGVNYFGFETDTRYPHGLWQVCMRSQVTSTIIIYRCVSLKTDTAAVGSL
jgi:hypothetical protein